MEPDTIKEDGYTLTKHYIYTVYCEKCQYSVEVKPNVSIKFIRAIGWTPTENGQLCVECSMKKGNEQ